MRSLHPFLLLAVLFTAACKKDNPTPITDPPMEYSPVVAFGADRYGSGELDAMVRHDNIATVIIRQAQPNISYTFEITGSNGLKLATDTTIRRSGVTDEDGQAFIHSSALYHYKDGDLTVNVHFAGDTTTVTAKVKKEEFLVRSYRDLMGLDNLHYLNRSSADVYVQMQDIAFPDTAFLDAVIVTPFSGVYDGQGHKITNYAVAPVQRSGIGLLGLFGYLNEQSVVKNVRLEYAPAGINTPNSVMCGGIAGILDGGSIINCSVKGSMKGPSSTCYMGGIAGQMYKGRIIGCAFYGNMEGSLVGGLAGMMLSGYVNMSYSNFSVKANNCGGLIGQSNTPQDLTPRDTVLNCYAFIRQSQATRLSALFTSFPVPPALSDVFVYDHCFSNAPTAQDKAIMYTTAQELNNQLVNLTVSNLPANITPPTGNKPFKITSDATAPAMLWWE